MLSQRAGGLLVLACIAIVGMFVLSETWWKTTSVGHTSVVPQARVWALDINPDPGTPPPQQPPYGAVIASGTKHSDLSWMTSLEGNWTTYPYNVDLEGDSQPNTQLRIPVNKGNEAMTYLSWIIDNYSHLPWSAIFTHGHVNTWHQDGTTESIVRDLNLTALHKVGYINLRCEWDFSCPKELEPAGYLVSTDGNDIFRKENELAIAALWTHLFPGEEMPWEVASPCCAQFAVTRQTILRRPKADYVRMRKMLVETKMQSIVSGRVFEKLWGYIFTGEGVRCPDTEVCRCEYFGRCGMPPLIPDHPFKR